MATYHRQGELKYRQRIADTRRAMKLKEAMFAADKTRAAEISYDAWKHRGLPQRLAELVFWIFEPYY